MVTRSKLRGAGRRRWALVALAAVLGLGGLPCHWAVAGTAGATAPPVEAVAPGSQAASTGPTLGDQAPASQAHEIRITLSEWALLPARISIPVGRTVRFLATNAGVLAHSLAVEGDGLYVESEIAGAGDTIALDVAFSLPGLYDLYCPVNAGQHRALGQEGIVVIVPATSELGLPRTGTGGEAELDGEAGEPEAGEPQDSVALDPMDPADDLTQYARSDHG